MGTYKYINGIYLQIEISTSTCNSIRRGDQNLQGGRCNICQGFHCMSCVSKLWSVQYTCLYSQLLVSRGKTSDNVLISECKLTSFAQCCHMIIYIISPSLFPDIYVFSHAQIRKWYSNLNHVDYLQISNRSAQTSFSTSSQVTSSLFLTPTSPRSKSWFSKLKHSILGLDGNQV